MRRRIVLSAVAIVAVIGISVGLWAFQPWKAFTSSELHEASPLATEQAAGEPDQADESDDATGPQPLASGTFVSQEHETSGKALVIERPDGSRVLRLTGLASSDGPDLHVWLTDAAAGLDEWGAYDDGRYVALGELKATHGSHNYAIPTDADIDGLRSVVIWCDRFNVAFGSAALDL
ncbi:DM13 domain-containing protein [Haloechinothrix halophila]|uniref:Electron transfer DM13 n=1 Tax=Haloechinothrix halophila YIM 93223 TaxID=592678 RepID=W9DSD6_9PSEU|nr:DM13 domain-containing protein [Haloechinothrix halophila]ETA66567.1 Electron transfer DM13 [Haloechinothrix halophila YIM 93223]